MKEIDEINKCKYNMNGSCKLEILTPCGIVPCKDCYYKQLKRKTEECEELKKYQYEQEYIDKEMEKYQQALQKIKNHIEDDDDANPNYLGGINLLRRNIRKIIREVEE